MSPSGPRNREERQPRPLAPGIEISSELELGVVYCRAGAHCPFLGTTL